MDEWQLIGTAPQNGTHVWLAGKVTDDGKDSDHPDDAFVVLGYFYETWRAVEDDEILKPPTHWMPFYIPKPPQ